MLGPKHDNLFVYLFQNYDLISFDRSGKTFPFLRAHEHTHNTLLSAYLFTVK